MFCRLAIFSISKDKWERRLECGTERGVEGQLTLITPIVPESRFSDTVLSPLLLPAQEGGG